MKIREQAKKTLESLDHAELITIYNMMLSLKNRGQKESYSPPKLDAYRKVRTALQTCAGNLSDDIIQFREDRI